MLLKIILILMTVVLAYTVHLIFVVMNKIDRLVLGTTHLLNQIDKERVESKKMKYDNLNINGSGCKDPTACEAIGKTDKELKKLNKLLDCLRHICDLAGFEIEGRIVLKNKKTGKIWR